MKYAAQAKYDKEHTKGLYLKLNKETDADIIAKLEEVDGKQTYIKDLIRKDIEYVVILSTRGTEEVHFIGSLEDCRIQENLLRQACREKDPDGVEMDCYTISGAELRKAEEAKEYWDTLTEEEKHDYIEVDGKKYIRKIYEKNHK
jgi:hypothetical protein